MLNKIIIGISQALDAEFNAVSKGYEIHTEGLEQGLDEPCFFIFSLKPMQTQIIRNRYKRDYSFDVHFFPDTALNEDGLSTINTQINEVTERLYDALEYITVDGNLIRGTNMNGEKVDDVLHFFVNYDMYVIKVVAKEESMGDITITQKIGG